MDEFQTERLARSPTSVAPDGFEVKALLRLKGGSMARFQLAGGQISRAVAHRTVEEIWFFTSGGGEIWRKQGERQEIVSIEAGVCVTIPRGTSFQARSVGPDPLTAIAVTMPPWPGDDEAYRVEGPWAPTVPQANILRLT